MLKDLEERNHLDDQIMQDEIFNHESNDRNPFSSRPSASQIIAEYKNQIISVSAVILIVLAAFLLWPESEPDPVPATPTQAATPPVAPKKVETAIAETVVEERPVELLPIIEPIPIVEETLPEPEIEIPVSPFVQDIFPKELTGSWNLQTLSIVGENFSEDNVVRVCWPGKCVDLPAERLTYHDNNRMEVQIRTGLSPSTWRLMVTDSENRTSNSKSFTVLKGDPIASAPVKQQRPLTRDEQIELLYQQGRTLYQNDEYAKALSKWREALDMKDDHHKSREAIVSHYLAEGRVNEANAILSIASRRYPQHSPYILMLARIYVDSGDPDKALIIIQNGIENVRDDPELYAFLGAIYQNKNEYIKSINNYRKALQINSKNAIWWLGLAISLEKDLSRIDAIKAYRESINTGKLSNSLKQFALKKIQHLENLDR